MSVLIVGASVAGIRAAMGLRAHGYDGAITVVESESETPYDKPPLSKGMLLPDGIPTPVQLVSADELSALDVDLRLGTTALALDPERRIVSTADENVAYTSLIVATGVRPRRIAGTEALSGVYTLRQARDARALRAALPAARNVVIVGAGFIGAEFASVARKYDCSVNIVETQQTPLEHLLGRCVGAEIACLHEMNGVAVHTGTSVAGFLGSSAVEGVRLSDGRCLPADLVLVGIGAEPGTEWLRGSGLPIQNGIQCDTNLRVIGFPGIYAAGDVALRYHPLYGCELRIEHWTNAGEQGALVAATIVGATAPAPQLPYVWSDQYGRRIQIIGRPALGELTCQRGAVRQGPYLAVYADHAGTLVGAVAVDDTRALMSCRRAIAARQPAHTLLSEAGPRLADV
ncbi:p-cumate dioxygenase [Mycolicibacterium sp. CH28]|uniref:NAD(P)/FAD-dependent oxidoreductase n=1 Tax=Mycolicibacterium sp. CH28 TaxID=2512237 RepID=UPI001080B9BB|nr:FAD-dependent oxidoreductase [Mycolicibacterium sp. CH28]TGD85225.1 p-cumate dioxygenase [Mycolicibacterium sp. CH28]